MGCLVICPRCASNMSGKPRVDKCEHCGAIVKIATLSGKQRHDAQLKVEMRFRTAHREVFLDCGEMADVTV